MSEPERYSKVAVILHWVIAILMIFMLFFGEELMDRSLPTGEKVTWHASVGTAILFLTLLRLFWRLGHTPPPYPVTMKPWEVKLAKGTHHLFYLLMIILPLTGLASFGSYLSRASQLADATLFGLIPVPALTWGIGHFLGEIHEIGSKLMWALLALHVLAALKHQFVDKDRIFARMR